LSASYALGSNLSPRSIAIGDLDDDGVLDLTTANLANTVSVFIGTGQGTFGAATSYHVAGAPYSVAIGDLDGDGAADLATANESSDTVSVLFGTGLGTFHLGASHSVGVRPRSVAIGDLDGDGALDLVTANSLSDDVSVLLGAGQGTFGAAVSYAVGDAPRSVAIGDLDGDGAFDLATANYGTETVSVLLGTGQGAFLPAVDYGADDSPQSVAIGDLDGAGGPDLATANSDGDTLSILLNQRPSSATNYCTAGTSASGCRATLSASGSPSATIGTGFVVNASSVEGLKDGLYFFGTNGAQANSWGNGTSFQCVVPPVKRAGLLHGTGTQGACDGSFGQDLNAHWCPTCPKPSHNPGAGASVNLQLWYRDPLSTSNQTTSLSDGIEFTLGPQ
jgi:hypothetical protein